MDGESRTKPYEPPIRQEVGGPSGNASLWRVRFSSTSETPLFSMLYVPKWFYFRELSLQCSALLGRYHRQISRRIGIQKHLGGKVSEGGKSGKGGKPDTCELYNCGKTCHIARNCPAPRTEGSEKDQWDQVRVAESKGKGEGKLIIS